MTYLKEAFDVITFPQAKHVVLTTSDDPNKFEKETQFLIDVLCKENIVRSNDTVLDFGCGMGRVSKELVHQLNANVIGVDISESMLTFAKLYVAKPQQFNTFTNCDNISNVDVVISTFVLQHVENPKKEIETLISVLKPGGHFVLVNESKRLIPYAVDSAGYVLWDDDSFDVFAEIQQQLTEIKSIPYINTELSIKVYKKL